MSNVKKEGQRHANLSMISSERKSHFFPRHDEMVGHMSQQHSIFLGRNSSFFSHLINELMPQSHQKLHYPLSQTHVTNTPRLPHS